MLVENIVNTLSFSKRNKAIAEPPVWRQDAPEPTQAEMVLLKTFEVWLVQSRLQQHDSIVVRDLRKDLQKTKLVSDLSHVFGGEAGNSPPTEPVYAPASEPPTKLGIIRRKLSFEKKKTGSKEKSEQKSGDAASSHGGQTEMEAGISSLLCAGTLPCDRVPLNRLRSPHGLHPAVNSCAYGPSLPSATHYAHWIFAAKPPRPLPYVPHPKLISAA